MKKLLVMLFCLVCVCAFVYAQAATEAPAAETVTATEAPATVDGVPAGRVVVPYWCTFTGANGEFIQTTVDEFNASQDKYWVVKEYCGNYMEQLAKIQISEKSERPALCTGSTEQVGTMKFSGLIKRMDEMVSADDPIVANMVTGLKSTWGDAQGLVGYPLGNSMSLLVFNGDICEKAGVNPYEVTSMEKLYEACKKIVDGGYAKMGIGTDHSGIYINYSLAIEGIDVLNNENGADGIATKVIAGEEPARQYVAEWLTIAQNMQKDGCWYPLGASWGGEVLPAFCSGDIAIVQGTIGGYARIVKAWKAAYGEDSYPNTIVVPWVSVTENAAREGYPASGTGFYVIDNGNDESMKGAIEYLRYFVSEDVQYRWCMQTGYMPLTTNMLAEGSQYMEFINTQRSELKYLLEKQSSMGVGKGYYPVNPIDTEWKAAWIGAVEKVTSDTTYSIESAIDEMVADLQDALDIWHLTNTNK